MKTLLDAGDASVMDTFSTPPGTGGQAMNDRVSLLTSQEQAEAHDGDRGGY